MFFEVSVLQNQLFVQVQSIEMEAMSNGMPPRKKFIKKKL